MVSQRITIDILNHAGADLYARTGEGDSRAVIFKVTSGEDSVIINNPVVEARIVKPDNTFTITTAALISGPDEPQEFRFYIPEAASQVSGIGSYDIRIQEDGEENIVYSAQGRFICDDNMLTDEMIESVAEVDGLIFPDDFLTKNDNVAMIDDNVIRTDKTWSSSKIVSEIASPDYTNTSTGNPIELADAADAPLISCATAITGYQKGSGTPSPDNIRPIVAYTEGEIDVSDGDGNTTTHTTTYPSAIYRGSEDVVNGSVTAEKQVSKLKDLSWNYSYGVFFSPTLYNDGLVNSPVQRGLWCLSNKYFRYSTGFYDTMPNGSIMLGDSGFSGGTSHVIIKDERFNNVSDFIDSLTNDDVIVYELATPTTSSVTPTNLPVKSLSGYTHIESTTGDMEVEYIKSGAQSLVDLIEAVTR